MLAINVFILILLIIITAFFVISEFAIVRVRKIKIESLMKTGNKRAVSAHKVLSQLDSYLSACQLGITMTSLGIGWIGDPSIGKIVERLLGYFPLSEAVSLTLSVLLSFAIITFFNVVLGELAPKSIAIQKAETMVLFIARPLIIFNYVMYPFIWLLNKSARIVSALFGVKDPNGIDEAHTEEELRQILSESYQYGEINQAEYKYVNRIFEFDDRIAKEIMVPRTEVICLYQDQSLEENIAVMQQEKYTRYPVAVGDKDHIVGLVNIKELFYAQSLSESLSHIERFIHPIIQVIETIPIKKLLVKMQKEHFHMAVLLDEYGGTSGIVTVEDILEEIVGEIRDEFDADERPMIEKLSDNQFLLDGKVLLSEINELLDVAIEKEDIDTIGGYLLSELTKIEIGQQIETNDYMFEIVEMEGHQIKFIKAFPKVV